MLDQLLQRDKDLLIYLNSLGSEKYDLFWFITTDFLTWIPLFIFIIILFILHIKRKERRWVLLSFNSTLIVLVIAIFVVKHSVSRLRPVNDVEVNTFLRILTQPTDYSFFSGHAASSFFIATFTVLFLRKQIKGIYLVYLWPLFFAYSRLYLGVHYPLDIAVGFVVGVSFACLSYKLHKGIIKPYIM